MLKLKCALVLAMLVFVNGCATIVSGTDQKVTFNSEPEGATVTVSGRVLGKTPLTVSVDKGKNQAVVFEKEGYKTYTAQLSTSLEGWFWGNLVIGGLVGSTTDGVSGAIHEFSPDSYYVTLVPLEAQLSDKSKSSKLREFVVGFGSEIRSELAASGGENVDALIELLGTESSEASIAAISKLATENTNDIEFANALINLYGV